MEWRGGEGKHGPRQRTDWERQWPPVDRSDHTPARDALLTAHGCQSAAHLLHCCVVCCATASSPMSAPPLHPRPAAASSSPPLPSSSPPTESPSPLSPSSGSPSGSVFVPPIAPGANYHTGAVDGHVTLLAAPTNSSFAQTADLASFLSPGALPIRPRRFNDDITDHGMMGAGSAGASPLFNGRPPQRAVSTPQTPKFGPDAGNTGCAPAVESAAAAAAMAAAGHAGHVHRINRFAHIGDGHTEDDAGERDAPDVPESRSLFEKDHNGVFQFASTHHKIGDAAALMRNRSKLNLATMSSPAGGGAGPRAPPIALVSAALSSHDLARATSEENSFHPHGTAKLPYNRVLIDFAPSAPSVEHKEIASHVRKCLELRSKFVWTPLRSEKQYNVFDNPEYHAPSIEDPMPPKHSKIHLAFEQGVFCAWHGEEDIDAKDNVIFAAPNRAEFGAAMATVMDFVISGPVKSVSTPAAAAHALYTQPAPCRSPSPHFLCAGLSEPSVTIVCTFWRLVSTCTSC